VPPTSRGIAPLLQPRSCFECRFYGDGLFSPGDFDGLHELHSSFSLGGLQGVVTARLLKTPSSNRSPAELCLAQAKGFALLECSRSPPFQQRGDSVHSIVVSHSAGIAADDPFRAPQPKVIQWKRRIIPHCRMMVWERRRKSGPQ